MLYSSKQTFLILFLFLVVIVVVVVFVHHSFTEEPKIYCSKYYEIRSRHTEKKKNNLERRKKEKSHRTRFFTMMFFIGYCRRMHFCNNNKKKNCRSKCVTQGRMREMMNVPCCSEHGTKHKDCEPGKNTCRTFAFDHRDRITSVYAVQVFYFYTNVKC
jgi:hypothetical protein